ncbi:sugar ABC transporter substrate-binding protein [Microbacterium sp. X-17]|uniref:sugar ABC transporter substrate-binding protein n=1 Tax=Microbacterium sp. X-17 TaxID=3144404 RepID=UPI0031F4904A
MQSLVVRRAAAAAAILLLFGLAGCGSLGSTDSRAGASPGSTVAVDVGTDKPVQLPTGKLKIGYFMNAMSNQWQKAITTAATEKAKEFGWDIDILDFNYDQQKMLDAMQTAVTNKTYDAWIVNPIDGVASCKMLTQTAPAANILVTVTGTTVCGRDLNTGTDLWAPGTYSYHAMAPSPDYNRAWFAALAKANPGPQTVAIMVGPAENGATILAQKTAQEFEAAHPEFHIADYVYTDYTAPTSLKEAQSYLQAHKDTTLMLSIYSPDISQGMVQAVKSVGLDGKIKLSDAGGSQYTVDQIKAGVIQLTMPFYPKTQGENAVQAIKDAQDGVTPKRIYDEIPGGVQNALVVDSSNVADFTPQF